MAKKKRPARERPDYSPRFLSNYGRDLKMEEIRLVQGYRGLTTQQREALLTFVSEIIIANAQAGVHAGPR